jgi:hypothetical protein
MCSASPKGFLSLFLQSIILPVYDEWPWHSLTIWRLHIKGQIHESELRRERGALTCGESPLLDASRKKGHVHYVRLVISRAS